MAQPSRAELIARLQADVAETVSDGVALQEALADRLGLTISDLRAITLLMRKGTVSTSELADAAGLTSGAATRMVDRLERANWVERFMDARDRRRVLVVMKKTRRGEIGELYAEMSQSWMSALSDKSEAELETVLEIFDRMRGVARDQAQALREAP
ncbi:MAG: MarR family transcriptional regulator [Actinobacteria bacterium]|nr:MarR family transcriptional regulator [Actinomycetota bacterium]